MKQLKDLIPTLSINAFSQLHFSSNLDNSSIELIDPEEFLVQRLEDTVSSINLPIPPHRKTVYDFIVIKEGEAQRTFGLTNYSLKPNQVFLMPSNQITSTPFISPDIRGYYCHFNLSFLEGLIPYFDKLFIFKTNLVVINLSQGKIDSICYKLDVLSDLSNTDLKHKKAQLALALMAVLFEIENHIPVAGEKRNVSSSERITAEFKRLLNNHIRSLKKVGDYADLLNISPNHLNKCVKIESGKSANQWILDSLLLESKSLLIQSNSSISEISFALNFDDPSYFSRFFKASTGLSPLQYRRQNKF
ncbi:helix-turn-helix domain-containing protein [Pararhodonellum marinum]|uniref:helix-turn-helix domain-containing protein n=1 Tax=Pararhodonellum marinum TaxID=2755358 RepID=UPI00188F30F1|nr:AraC family transcriptional regulator [Pararhodonellum marinum]